MATADAPKNLPRIKIGLALSDLGFYHRETMKLPDDLSRFFQLYREKFATDALFFELQPEAPWLSGKSGFLHLLNTENRWYELGMAAERESAEGAFAEIVREMHRPGNIVGAHQSIRDMDVLADDQKKLATIESTHQAMLFAHRISARYFVFHLAQSRDYWDWNRSEQIAVALKVFQGLAQFYKESGFTFVPLLENLEFPKFPATFEEIIGIFNACREFLPNLKLCFDIPHLWHSRLLLLENRHKFRHLMPEFHILEGRFSDYFDHAMDAFAAGGISNSDIFLYHLGGCWQHLTHEIPGLRPGESPFTHKLRLDEPEYSYDPHLEMNMPRILNRLLRHHIENRQDVFIMLEIYQRDYIEMLEAARIIYEDLNRKAARIAENARRYAYLWEH